MALFTVGLNVLTLCQPAKTPQRNVNNAKSALTQQWNEVVVFGYPQDKAKAAEKLFRSLGESNEPVFAPEDGNWFKIGYKHEWEAARAVRKNGELVNGAWMVGVKWAVSDQSHFVDLI